MSPTTAPLPPLPLSPIHVEKVWGGDALRRRGRAGLPVGPVGESFEASGLPGAISHVARGPFAGHDLAALHDRFGIFGDTAELPFLIKILDVTAPLSVQVHPGAERSARMGLGCAKSEGWVVLAATSESEIGLGLRPDVDRARLAALCRAGDPRPALNLHHPTAGELYFLKSGTAHYATGGILLYEFQRPADATLRLHDWGRERPGIGTLDEALEAVFEGRDRGLGGAPGRPFCGPGQNVAEHHEEGFSIRFARTTAGATTTLDTGARVAALTVIEGSVELRVGAADETTLHALETALIPASTGALLVTGDGAVLTCAVTS